MKKVMVIHGYGSNWEYSLYMINEKSAKRIDRLIERGEYGKAYDLAKQVGKINGKYRASPDWDSIESVDIMLEYIEGVTV